MSEMADWLNWITTIFSFFTMIGIGYNYFKNKKQLNKIKIVFLIESSGKEIVIDGNLTRKDCQRSEIQGVLRTKLLKDKNFYGIEYLKNDSYLENIYLVQIGKSDKIVVRLKDDEIEQFGVIL